MGIDVVWLQSGNKKNKYQISKIMIQKMHIRNDTKTGLLMLLLTLIMGSCANYPVKVACVGDSITYGSGIKLRSLRSYPARLDRILGRNYKVENFGVSGATLLKKGDVPYWQVGPFQASQEYLPDIVVIKLGTNDSKPENWVHSDEYIDDYREMIRTYRELESEPMIFICTPVPAYEQKWGINPEIIEKELFPALTDLSEDEGVVLIDLYHPFVDHEEHFPDKIHPNAKGARLIAEEVAGYIERLYP
jgi:lysophospholipase L1-like esterase